MELPSAGFYPVDSAALSSIPGRLTRQQKRLLKLISAGSRTTLQSAKKSWSLRFLLSPHSFVADQSNHKDLVGISLKRNKLEFDLVDHPPKAVPIIDQDTSSLAEALNSSTIHISSSLAFRSIGYAGMPLSGLVEDRVVFVDKRTGNVGSDGNGRVLKASSSNYETSLGNEETVPGLYITGWARNGPSGVIASTMVDAFSVGDTIASDLKAGKCSYFPIGSKASDAAEIQQSPGLEAVQREISRRGLRMVSWKDWQRIDKMERYRGKQLNKEREKLVSVKDMLNVIDQ